ncbi:MAG TPA: type II secretion system protein [bacterium]|jgi:prepilin-type N-terminal cleavage/methylation domain-containing protein
MTEDKIKEIEKTENSVPENERGFTLLEILLVVSIITVIVSMGIIQLNGAKRGAYELSAIKALNTLGSAEIAYRNVHRHFTNFEGLRQREYVNENWRKYGRTDRERLAKHYSIDFFVRDTFKDRTYGFAWVAYPDPGNSLNLHTFRMFEDGIVEQSRDGVNWLPR